MIPITPSPTEARVCAPHRKSHGPALHATATCSTPCSTEKRLTFYLENRAKGCTTAREKLERKMERARKKGRGQKLSKKLALARAAEQKAVELARNVRILSEWMEKDILSLAGPNLAERRKLFDFVVGELDKREHLSAHRIAPVRRALENQRDNLLAFAAVLDEKLEEISRSLNVPAYLVHAVCELQGIDHQDAVRYQREAELRDKLCRRFHDVEKAVREAMASTPRASSIVENLNSRLRNYFFLRRHLGPEYLELLRFFLNHRRFMRSERPERVGKSPTELLTGKDHPHWLEMLGFERFHRN